MSTKLPPQTRGWAYLTSFRMTLHRIYRYAGARRSFASAACTAPAGFPGAVFPFAKATYGFDDLPPIAAAGGEADATAQQE